MVQGCKANVRFPEPSCERQKARFCTRATSSLARWAQCQCHCKQKKKPVPKKQSENERALVTIRPASVPAGQAVSSALRPASVPADFNFDADQSMDAAGKWSTQRACDEKFSDLRCQIAIGLEEQSQAKATIRDLETKLQEEMSYSISCRDTIAQLRELIRKRDREVKAAKHQVAMHWKGDVDAKAELQAALDREHSLQQQLSDRDKTIQRLEGEFADERSQKEEIIRQATAAAHDAALYKQNALAEHAALKSRLRNICSVLMNEVETLRKGQQDARADVVALARETKSSILNIAETSKKGKEADDLALAKEKDAVASLKRAKAKIQDEKENLQAENWALVKKLEDSKAELVAAKREADDKLKSMGSSKIGSKWQSAMTAAKQIRQIDKLTADLVVRDAHLAIRSALEEVQTTSSSNAGRYATWRSSSPTPEMSDFPSTFCEHLQKQLASHKSNNFARPMVPPEYFVLELVDVCKGAADVAFPVFQQIGQRLVEQVVSASETDRSRRPTKESNDDLSCPIASSTTGREPAVDGLLEFCASPPKDIATALLEQRVRERRPFEVCFLYGEVIIRDPDVVSVDSILRLASLEWPMDQLDSPCLFGIRKPIGSFSRYGGKPLVILDLNVQGFACEILISEVGSGEAPRGIPAKFVDHGEIALLTAAYGEPIEVGADVQLLPGLHEAASDVCDARGFSTLHYAAAWGRVGIIKDVLNSSSLAAMATDSAGRFAFHRAVENNHFEAAVLVAEKVIDVAESSQQRCNLSEKVSSPSPAGTAESKAILDRLVELMIVFSPKLRKIDKVSHSDAEHMRQFWKLCVSALKHAAYTEETENDSCTGNSGSQEGHSRLLHGIVAAGCPAFAVEHLLDVAATNKYVERLLAFGKPDKEGQTPSDLAILFDDAEAAAVTNCLLRHGGTHSPFFLTSNCSAEDLRTSLESVLASLGNERAAELVQVQRASDGEAPLHVAVRQKDRVKCFELLRAGANPDAKNNFDETPADLYSADTSDSPGAQTSIEVEIGTLEDLETVWEALQDPQLTLTRDVLHDATTVDSNTSNGTPLPKIFRGDKLVGIKVEREGQIYSAEPSALIDGPEVLLSCLGNRGLPITLVVGSGLRRLQAEACGGLPLEVESTLDLETVELLEPLAEEAAIEAELALLESGQKPETVVEKLQRLIKAAEDAGVPASDTLKRAGRKVAELQLSEATKPASLGACLANAHHTGVAPPVVVKGEVKFAQAMSSKSKAKSSKLATVVKEASEAIHAMIEAPSWQKADPARVALGQLVLFVASKSGDTKMMREALTQVNRAWESAAASDSLSKDTVQSLKAETAAAEMDLTVNAKTGPWAELEEAMSSGAPLDELQKKVKATQKLGALGDIGKRALVRAELHAALYSEHPDPDELDKAIKAAEKQGTVPDPPSNIVIVDTKFAKEVAATWRQIKDGAQVLAAASSTAVAPASSGAAGDRQYLENRVADACQELHRVCTEAARNPHVCAVSQNMISAANNQVAEAQLLSRARLHKNDKQILREITKTAKASGLVEPARFAREQLARMQSGEVADD